MSFACWIASGIFNRSQLIFVVNYYLYNAQKLLASM